MLGSQFWPQQHIVIDYRKSYYGIITEKVYKVNIYFGKFR